VGIKIEEERGKVKRRKETNYVRLNFLKELIFQILEKKTPVITRKFITVFSTARHLPPSCTKSIQSTVHTMFL
jgi:hypothetical protein